LCETFCRLQGKVKVLEAEANSSRRLAEEAISKNQQIIQERGDFEAQHRVAEREMQLKIENLEERLRRAPTGPTSGEVEMLRQNNAVLEREVASLERRLASQVCYGSKRAAAMFAKYVFLCRRKRSVSCMSL
jgi:hypothetical protein